MVSRLDDSGDRKTFLDDLPPRRRSRGHSTGYPHTVSWVTIPGNPHSGVSTPHRGVLTPRCGLEGLEGLEGARQCETVIVCFSPEVLRLVGHGRDGWCRVATVIYDSLQPFAHTRPAFAPSPSSPSPSCKPSTQKKRRDYHPIPAKLRRAL